MQTLTVKKWVTLFWAGLLFWGGSPESGAALAETGTGTLIQLETQLQKLPTDLYERLELLDRLQKKLNTAEVSSTDANGHMKALQGLLLFHQAIAQSERGASAIDYWAFMLDVVEPLQARAKDAFDAALADDETLTPTVKAWSHYYRGLLTAEYAEAAAQADFKAACALGYALACAQK